MKRLMRPPGIFSTVILFICLQWMFIMPGLAQNGMIESLAGPVTANEIGSIRTAVADLVPGDSNHHNNYAYGNGGHAMEACGDMFDITKDRFFLDKMIFFCDHVVSIRNTNSIMWTGRIDPVWPNNTNNIWGCEQGDVAGHLAYCAQLIAQNPALWNTPVDIGDTNGYGATYKLRAMKYLAVADGTMELFYQNGFIHADELMETPPTPVWPDAHSAGKAVPWNQQGMICSTLVRSAQAHFLFHDGSTNIARFRKTATASIQRFQAQCENFKYEKSGRTVCQWSYTGNRFAPGEKIRYPEDTAHGGYDITAFWRARHWLAGSATEAAGRMLADTLMEVIKSGDKFASRVDGAGSLKPGMKSSWTYLAEFRPDVFAATTKTGKQDYADAARKLWIKNAIYNGWPPVE
jgi:hypothetical protein